MQITLTPKRKDGAKGSIRPGEDVEITIKATDPQGKPVSAELSVGMVEQALLNLFSPNRPADQRLLPRHPPRIGPAHQHQRHLRLLPRDAPDRSAFAE